MSAPSHFVPLPSVGVGSLDDSDLLVARNRAEDTASAFPDPASIGGTVFESLSRLFGASSFSPQLRIEWRRNTETSGVAEWAFGPRKGQCAAVPTDRSRVGVFSSAVPGTMQWLEHREMASKGKGAVRSLAWSPLSGNLLVVGLIGKLHLWQLRTFESSVRDVFKHESVTHVQFPAAASSAPACAVVWHPKGRWVLTVLGGTKTAAIVDVYLKECTLLHVSETIPEDLGSDALKFTPGGEHAILVLPSGCLTLWETVSWRRNDWTLTRPCFSVDADPCLLRGCWLCIGPHPPRTQTEKVTKVPSADGVFEIARPGEAPPADGLDLRLPVCIVQVSQPAPIIDARIRSLFLLPQAIEMDEQYGSPARLLRDRFQGTPTQLVARQIRFDPSGCLLAISGALLPTEIEDLAVEGYFTSRQGASLALPALEQVVLLLSVQSTPRLHCALLDVFCGPNPAQSRAPGVVAMFEFGLLEQQSRQLTPKQREEVETELRSQVRAVAAECAPRIAFTAKDDGAAATPSEQRASRNGQAQIAQLSVGWAGSGGLHFYDIAV